MSHPESPQPEAILGSTRPRGVRVNSDPTCARTASPEHGTLQELGVARRPEGEEEGAVLAVEEGGAFESPSPEMETLSPSRKRRFFRFGDIRSRAASTGWVGG